jgi:hypothetical protein
LRLGVEGCESGIVFEGAVGGIPAVGVYGYAQGGSVGCPNSGDVCGVAGPIGKGGSCDKGAVEAGYMLKVFLTCRWDAYIMLASLLFHPCCGRAQS